MAQGLLPLYRGDHYPSTLIDVWHSRQGERFVLRPVLPQDHHLLGDLIERLTPASRHNRFHGAVNRLSELTLQSMTCIDYHRELAVVIAIVVAGVETVVADARYVLDDSEPESAEFALVVDDQWRRRGLGARAMRGLCDAAHRAGVKWLHGSVWAANTPMLSLMRQLEFCCTPDQEDDRLVQVELRLDAPGTSDRSRFAPAPWLARWLAPWRGVQRVSVQGVAAMQA